MTDRIAALNNKRRTNIATRLVVTAIDEEGKSYFKHDGPTPGQIDLGLFVDEEIWIGDAMEDDNPGMHTTASIDYGIVLSGNISLELDSGTVDLKPGDVVVQRATRHAWRNRSDQPAKIAFILIASPNYQA